MTAASGQDAPRGRFPLAALTVGAWVVVLSFFVILGSDLMWVVALGDDIRSGGGVPQSIPFAAAPQTDWHNPIALAELVLATVHAVSPWGLAALQVILAGATLATLAVEGRRMGGSPARVAAVVSLVVVGTAAHLVITRLPSLSLVPFVLALLVMRRQHENPGRGVWLLVPLFLLWGNLHGAVLVGLAVLGVFLVASRGGGPLLRRVGVAVGCVTSLVLTSAWTSTPAYYVSALGNEAAARNTDLWARPSPTHPLDAAMLVVALVLFVLAARGRMPWWEWGVTAGLVVGTAEAGRNGLWLLLFLAPAAARSVRAVDAPAIRARRVVAPATAFVTAGLVVAVLVSRGEAVRPPGLEVVDTVRQAAAGGVVLADEPLAETLAQQGVTVWAANPIDAFPRTVQASFLDFLHDGSVPDDPSIRLVVVTDGLARAVVARGGWSEAGRVPGYVLLERSG